ncbi:hypothetical protein PCL_07306 [Purpureocillium lilacinum]|uniref:Uncharacterized protein n=1 Tax=Purpureocillium lilacinum TaxID=33203 RepID=A0A2U3DSN6_PURLI|nr:hypothetical protein PCL_07306 [Purpureocillium lilacinum]
MLCQRIPTTKAPLPAYSPTWELAALPWCHWLLALRSITVGTSRDLVAATRHTANWRDEGGVGTHPRNDVERVTWPVAANDKQRLDGRKRRTRQHEMPPDDVRKPTLAGT